MIVVDGAGASLGCGRDAADSLAAHWGPAFSESRGMSPAAADRVLLFAPRYSEAVLLDRVRRVSRACPTCQPE